MSLPGMEFPFGQTVWRDRRASVADPYKAGKQTRGEYDPSLTIEIPGAYVASSSSTRLADATRSEMLTLKSLFCANTTVDVLAKDRIRVGGTKADMASGTPYIVDARPEADVNPFTGWQPVVEIPLNLTEG